METTTTQKRELNLTTKQGLGISDLILVAILLAAGAVLKFFVGSIVNIGGMKPNFIIAMYCLAILLIKPRLIEAAIIGILAGAICQFFPGTPYLNLFSELCGALAMGLLIKLPIPDGRLNIKPIITAFLSTVVSGSLYVVLLFLVIHAESSALVAYVPIVLCTALFNSVIVQLLYLPLHKILKK